MVNINALQIDKFAAKIDVNVSTAMGNNIIRVSLWTSETFKDLSTAIDFTSKLSSTTQIENFEITAEDLGVEKITGVYFLEFESNEVIVPADNDSNIGLGVTANLILYHRCILDKLLKVQIDSCNPNLITTCESDCGEGAEKVTFINVLLQALEEAIKFGFYEEITRIVETLNDLCDVCHSCPDYEDTLLVNGLGFGTIDDSIISI